MQEVDGFDPNLALLCKNKKDRLHASLFCFCGWGEIRTHGPLSRATVFKTVALDHSATHPCGAIIAKKQGKATESNKIVQYDMIAP